MKIAFDIPHAEHCICHVIGYAVSHSTLEIKVGYSDRENAIEETHYVGFTSVEFFEGPMSWIGAEFRIADDSQCLALLKKVGRYSDIPDAYLAENFKLFVVSGTTQAKTDVEVRILARNGGLYEQNKPLFA
jgi:hypothetical protein